jgi:hypothetical protein
MKQMAELYLSFVNDFLTLGRFAEAHSLDVDDAETLIKLGKKYHERMVKIYKENN